LRSKNFHCQLDAEPLSSQEEIARTAKTIQRFHERQVMDLEGITLYPNLTYSTIHSHPLLLDIYMPASEERRLPTIVWVHGGGWWRGNKGHNCHGLKLIGRGYIIVSISYRFSTEAPFPAQLEDCKAAIRWLKANAQTYRIDPDRIGVWGSSAGGHLVAMLGVTEDDERFEVGEHLDYSSRVRAVCDFCGPTDLLQMAVPGTSTVDWNAPDSQASRLIGGALQENKEQARLASPVHYVGGNKTPPFLIVHSDHDQLVPWEQSRQLYKALDSCGAEVTFRTVEARGKGHGIDFDATLPLVEDFFDKHLK
jgi:acetyl esterase/lipase